jgi:hypothetical protein
MAMWAFRPNLKVRPSERILKGMEP